MTLPTDKVLALAEEANLEKVDVVDGLFFVNVEGLQTFAALIQRDMEADGWRSVKEGLPLVGMSVLVYEPDKHIQKTAHDGYDWCLPHKSNVTHWMPLPNPPSKERK